MPLIYFLWVWEIFKIIKDNYKGKEVSYYVEPSQAPYAHGVFGLTPEMIKFFSDKLGVEYPWPKYSQIVGREFVSGAMENTTATLHQESAYQNARELVDENAWESTIAHELFHQWFGDLVTAESWSNITVNESFANFSETWWDEYKHGKDAGDARNFQDMNEYLFSNSEKKNLVRLSYADKEDVFDKVSYEKGGRVLNMLRNYVGEDAFCKSLNYYLTTNKFKSCEAGQLRLAFEEITGEDLNWFWNQWYYGNGHPLVKIDYAYDDENGTAKVIIEQTQKTDKVFRLPLAIDVYNGSVKKRYQVWIENRIDTFTFRYTQKPDLINVDADKVMLWIKKDNKTNENFIAQWKNAPLYSDRKEALDYFAKKGMKELAEGLKDKYAPLRISTISSLEKSKMATDPYVVTMMEDIASSDKNTLARAAAIQFLTKTGNLKYLALYKKYVNDSSYSVAGASLEGLIDLEPGNAYSYAKKYMTSAKGDLGAAVLNILQEHSSESDFDFIADYFNKLTFSNEKFEALEGFCTYVKKMDNVSNVKKGIDILIQFRNSIPAVYREFTNGMIKTYIDKIGKAKGKELQDYIEEKMK